MFHYYHRENTRREESKYLECENRQLGLSAIATYIFKPVKYINTSPPIDERPKAICTAYSTTVCKQA